MADNIETSYTKRPQQSGSSVTGWILGVIVALVAIALLWYYATRGTEVATTSTATPNAVTTEQPATAPPAAPAAGTAGTGATSTTPPAPANP